MLSPDPLPVLRCAVRGIFADRLRRAGLFLATAAALGAIRGETKPGDPFPSLTGLLPPSEARALAGNVVLIDFWASWCAPCRASFSCYDRIEADFARRGLLIVAVSVDERVEAFTAFVRRLKPRFWTVRDADQNLVRLVQVPAMPTSYLVGRDGRVRFRHVGFHGAETERELRREIDQLLAEKPAAQ